jgi:hypothetical protein
MQWSADPAEGFTTAKPWQALQENAAWVTVENQMGDPGSLLSLYQRLIELHLERPSLSRGSFLPLAGTPSNLLAYVRQEGTELTLVVLNFGTEPVEFPAMEADPATLPVGNYAVKTLLGGVALPNLSVDVAGVITLQSTQLLTLAGRTGYVFGLAPAGPSATPEAPTSPTAPGDGR